jgi:CDGSH-type Zn-finger protein
MGALAGNETVTITAYKDGPYLVRGPFQLLDQDGNQLALARPTIALCRCGKSRIRPLCDGTHRSIGFRAPGHAEGGVTLAADEQTDLTDWRR